ncbi:MAG: HlyD family secretion protein [Thermodesulfobacteriota bacterium]|nr:HlyD family secretion protein [Thermodesulfobacteriota bacterium]
MQKKYLVTGSIVLVAFCLVLFKYRQYITNPWTRDGQVKANVIKVTPRVTGPIVKLAVRDNQFVKAGDLLFEIDPRTYQAALDQAQAKLEQTGDHVMVMSKQVESAEAGVKVAESAIEQAKTAVSKTISVVNKDFAEYERQKALLPKKATSKKAVETAKATYEVSIQSKADAEAGLQKAKSGLVSSQANLAQAQAQLGALGDKSPELRAAIAALRQAELNFEFTRVVAPVDGYVTNLILRVGSHAAANQPALALVDINSYWVNGFFQENIIDEIQIGDRAVVTLMSYHDQPITGRVDSIGWGIYQSNGATTQDLLPNISATFEWIRLAQRIPVRIHLDKLPDGIDLRVGSTCSVLVQSGTADESEPGAVVAVPRALQ